MTPRFPDAPPQIRALPLDPRGYPIPWFVGWYQGKRDFRVISPGQVVKAVKDRCCWICGRKLGEFQTFPIGPMCAVNRVSSEPPSHLDCARFAVRACPFLTNPQARRDPRGIDRDEALEATPGIMLQHNPGVTLLWRCRRARQDRDRLFRLGDPVGLEWYAEGRKATRDEVLAAIDKGLPSLEALVNTPAERLAFEQALGKALALVPLE